jgi:hypothetical protein
MFRKESSPLIHTEYKTCWGPSTTGVRNSCQGQREVFVFWRYGRKHHVQNNVYLWRSESHENQITSLSHSEMEFLEIEAHSLIVQRTIEIPQYPRLFTPVTPCCVWYGFWHIDFIITLGCASYHLYCLISQRMNFYPLTINDPLLNTSNTSCTDIFRSLCSHVFCRLYTFVFSL